MKTLHCKDAGFDCPGVISAATEEEVLNQAAQLVVEVHNLTVTPELVEQLRPLIKDKEVE